MRWLLACLAVIAGLFAAVVILDAILAAGVWLLIALGAGFLAWKAYQASGG